MAGQLPALTVVVPLLVALLIPLVARFNRRAAWSSLVSSYAIAPAARMSSRDTCPFVPAQSK